MVRMLLNTKWYYSCLALATVYGKTFKGKTSAVFHSIVNIFPRIIALSIGNISLQANNHFPL